ncbi:hypothetical protein DVH24_006197 [Malus domestica]|uniref:Uncharacterized protein n=1 Tax=Malus domestica TaxID=3750 RepID=A0A498KMZ7_MALDO|nr:hypothetical protein DVH24_006197 [Malus domestica]
MTSPYSAAFPATKSTNRTDELGAAISTQNSPPPKQLAAHPYSKQHPDLLLQPSAYTAARLSRSDLRTISAHQRPKVIRLYFYPTSYAAEFDRSNPSSQLKPAALPFSAISTPPSPPTLSRRRQYPGSSVSTLHPNRA